MPDPSGEILPQRQPETPQAPKPPETIQGKGSIGPQEQQIIDRAVQGGEPRKILEEISGDSKIDNKAGSATPNSIPDDAILDMVEGPDGKWSARDPSDPNFLYTPKPKGSAEAGTKPLSPKERFMRSQPIDLGGGASNYEGPAATKSQENLSPKERWMAAERRDQQREIEDNLEREKILNGIEGDGRNLAGLMYTEEGQRIVEETRNILTKIVGETSSRPTLFSESEDHSRTEIDRIGEMNKHLLTTWEETKRQKVEDLLQGGNLTNLEEAHYLRYMLGREPIATTNQNESSFRERAIAEFAQTRSNIGRGMLYKESDFKSPPERTPVYLSASARFYNISQGQAQEAFGRGWDTAKIQASVPKATE